MMPSLRSFLLGASLLGAVLALDLAEDCDLEFCSNSTCRCSSTVAPGGFDLKEIPQLVVITFDEAVTTSNIDFYEELSSFTNPNGCNISLTFFVSHQNTDYSLVNRLYRRGHEIATRSVTAQDQEYWNDLTTDKWTQEIVDMRTILEEYGNVKEEDVKGFRVPGLVVGGNRMYDALAESNFTYDSSWPTLQYTEWYPSYAEAKGTLWPYTLDYMSIQEETTGTKPNASFPGLWVSPMTDLMDDTGTACAFLDSCRGVNNETELASSPAAVYSLLRSNFGSHYYTDHSPFGVYTREAWFRDEDGSTDSPQKEGFKMFLDYLQNKQDVYLVTVSQLLEWVKNPTKLEDLGKFEPFQCLEDQPTNTCQVTKECSFKGDQLPEELSELEEVVMTICGSPCPPKYPWTGNPLGEEQEPDQDQDQDHD